MGILRKIDEKHGPSCPGLETGGETSVQRRTFRRIGRRGRVGKDGDLRRVPGPLKVCLDKRLRGRASRRRLTVGEDGDTSTSVPRREEKVRVTGTFGRVSRVSVPDTDRRTLIDPPSRERRRPSSVHGVSPRLKERGDHGFPIRNKIFLLPSPTLSRTGTGSLLD